LKLSWRRFLMVTVSASALWTCGADAAFAATNLAGNPGFEAALGGAANWDNTNGALRVDAGGMPGGYSAIPQGAFALRMNDGTFTFQTSTVFAVGDTVTFQARAESTAGAGTGGRLKLEFQNSVNAVIGTALSPLINTTNAPNGGGFQTFQAVGVVPANTVTVVYVIETFALGGANTAVFDDVLVTADSATQLAAGGTPVAQAGILGNASIEQPIGGNTLENWDNTNGAFQASNATLAANGFAAAPDGVSAMIVPEGSFTFQTEKDVNDGDLVTFSGFAQSSIAGGLKGGRLKIEFRKIVGDVNTLLSSSVSPFMNSTTADADPANPYVYFEVQAPAPANTNLAVFVIETVGNSTGNLAIDNLHGTVRPVTFSLQATSSSIQPGEPVTLLATFRNTSSIELSGLQFVGEFPPGFNLIKSRVLKDGRPTDFTEGSVIIPIGTLQGSQSTTVSFMVVANGGIALGKNYALQVSVRDNLNLSMSRTVQVLLEADPVFDMGTIIGKVFQDDNKNGVQDKGEKGVPWVRLATEEGVVIITDEHGRYSIPGVKEGRHVVKIDGHTLPEGTEFVTEESFLVKTTPGIMSKANFAVFMPPSKIPVEFQEDLSVRVTQGLDTSASRLTVQMQPDLLKTGLGVLEREAAFTLDCNYAEFVKRWFLEIRDELGREVWVGFGIAAPPSQVRWNGQMENGLLIKPGIYSYQFKVEDKSARQDWSPMQFFRVVSKNDANYLQDANVQIPSVGDFNLFKDGKRSIPLIAKPTLRVQGKTKPSYKVTVNDYPVNVDPNNGNFQTEVYTSAGDKEILVQSTSPDGETTSYRETVKVKDSTFFMVALSEGESGVNFTDGNLQTVADDSSYKNNIYTDGRLSYYLKGKLRGKFLVKSHYDSQDKRSALFKNLNENDYYPVYGDSSTRDYDAQNSLDSFYVIVEMDRSFARWGSFQTEFNDVELATYNRSLSGLKTHFETLATTPYGDAVRGVTAFWSEAGHRADHNEFLATGGTLYYLRNRRIMEGSEKVRVVVRDKIQDIEVSSRDLVEGQDYEIDYGEGRILLTRPLSAVSSSDTIISLDILDGNPQYLVVDYEFQPTQDTFQNGNRGLRGFTHMGDHLRVGGTYVEEDRNLEHYDMRGVDAETKIGRNTRIFAEYAESSGGQQTAKSVSYNGGLSFADEQRLRGVNEVRPRPAAYVLKGESKPIKNLEIGGFVQDVEPSFSNEHSRSQEGFKKYGLSTRYKLTDYTYLKYRYDSSEVVGELLPLAGNPIAAPFQSNGMHTAQAVYDDGKWLGGLEYQRQTPTFPEEEANLSPSLLSSVRYNNAVAAKFGYHINEKLLTYVKAQATMEGKSNNQFGGGLRYELLDGFYGYFEQMVGNIGDSVYMGFEKTDPRGVRSYANVRKWTRSIGTEPLVTTIGSSAPLTDKTRIYSERNYSTYSGQEGYTADASGFEGRLSEVWDINYDARFERRRLDSGTTRALDIAAANSQLQSNTITTTSLGLSGTDGGKLKAGTRLELRRDSDVLKLWQWVARGYVEYKYSEDLSLLSKIDYGKTMFSDPSGIPADFMEFSSGFGYRPVDNDKLNIIGRYTYQRDVANDIQFSTSLFNGLQTDEKAHILSVDFAYDMYKYLGFVEKLAAKRGIFGTAVSDPISINNLLWAHRFNIHVTRKWDLGLEYRALWQTGALRGLRHGALVEVDREFYEYVRLGAGYNFTDFDDDLRKTNSYSSHGPFVRLSGKF